MTAYGISDEVVASVTGTVNLDRGNTSSVPLFVFDQFVSSSLNDVKLTLSGSLAQIYSELNAGDVDIRSLNFSTDSVSSYQGGAWSVLQSGSWSVTASGDVGTIRQSSTRELLVSSSTVLARGNDGILDRNLLTDTAGRLQVTISSGSAGAVTVLSGSQFASALNNALVVHISPNQQPIPTTVVPQSAVPGSAVGRASSLSANVIAPVRQTTYVEQTTQAQRSIVSTSANDSAAGTGARTAVITYYDALVNGPYTEIVTLNGLTPVNTVATDICFIEKIVVLSVGANGSNVGSINLYTGINATGVIFAAIGTGAVATGVGDNQTFYAHHYVPAGKSVRGYVVTAGIIAAAGGGASVTVVRSRNPTSINSPWTLVSDFLFAAQGNSAVRVYTASVEISGPLVVTAFVTPANNNSTATCSFDYSEQ
jgi:hypothetical protein